MQDERQELTADDLALVSDPDDGGSAPDRDDAGKASQTAQDGKKAETQDKAADDGKADQKSTIAAGATEEDEEGKKPAKKADEADEPKDKRWPDDWRERMARRRAGQDDKAYKRELKRLQNFADPEGVYGMGREAESKLTSGKLLMRPDENAKPEEVKEFFHQLGAPEDHKDYYSNLTLDNGAVVGEADKPFLDDLAKTVHDSTTPVTPEQFKLFTNWYYGVQEKNAAEMDERDEDHQLTTRRELKEDWGPAFNRHINSINVLHQFHPRGKEGFEELINGRSGPENHVNGNNAEFIRMMVAMARDINPNATVTEDGLGTPQTTENRIREIEKIMLNDRPTYNKDTAMQKELHDLYQRREKNQARA